MEYTLPWAFFESSNRFQRGERHFISLRVRKAHVVKDQRSRARRNFEWMFTLLNHWLKIEYLKDTFKAHDCRHVVNVEARQLGKRAVNPSQISGEGHDRSNGQLPVQNFDTTKAVGEGCC